MSVFDLLHPEIRRLIAERGFERPTPPQELAIPRILRGENVLLVAPTGSGKTEAALLPVLDRLVSAGRRRPGIKALYVTPLRALNRDLVLRTSWWANNLDLKLAVRHGDTPQSERRRQAKSPPDILLTTPETLQVLVVADVMRKHLESVEWVIVDELHELAVDKRGSQLSLLLERLTRISGEFQRIGLSATVGSPETLARFLVGAKRVGSVIISKPSKPYDIQVVFPEVTEEDKKLSSELGVYPQAASRLRALSEIIRRESPLLLFTNTRSESEILVNRLRVFAPDLSVDVHHSSLSLDRRLDAESRLKSGELSAVVCTSSLELGIDVGLLNIVVQYGSPRQVTRLIQRVGRSGHSLERTSRGIVIAVDEDDALEAAVIARRSLAGQLEKPIVPHKPYDVLVQQLAGLLVEERLLKLEDALELFKKSYPYRDLALGELVEAAEFMSSLRPPLAGYSPSTKSLYAPPLLRRLLEYHFETLSMIPEEPRYVVVNDKGETIGFLDEEFVAGYVAVGVKFVLAGRPWIVKQVLDDRVIVEEAEDPTGAIPSWVGEEIPVPEEVALEVGALRRVIANGEPYEILCHEYGLECGDAMRAAAHILEQASRGLPVPSDKLVTIEKWGEHVIVHTHRGLKANRVLSRVLAKKISEKLGVEVVSGQDPYRVYLRGSFTTEHVREALLSLADSDIDQEVRDAFSDSWLFSWRLVQAARKMGVVKASVTLSGSDVRKLKESLRGTLVYKEAWRTVLEQDLDVRAVRRLIRGLTDGSIGLADLGELKDPSPVARIGLEKAAMRGEVVEKARIKKLVLASAKSRLKWAQRTVACMECYDYVERTSVESLEHPLCPVCGSRKLAVLEEDEEDVRAMLDELLESGEPSGSLKQLYRKALRTSALVEKYGKPALVALLFKIPYSSAERILSKHWASMDELLLALAEEERKHVLRGLAFLSRRSGQQKEP